MSRTLDSMLVCPAPLGHRRHRELAHGGGGTQDGELVETLFAPAFRNPHLEPLGDGALLDVGGERLAFTTDTFVVSPSSSRAATSARWRFTAPSTTSPCAAPSRSFLSAGFLLEEGFPMRDLERVVASMAAACARGGVQLVTGDTKVVDRGKGDGIFINTAGIGRVRAGVHVGPARAGPATS